MKLRTGFTDCGRPSEFHLPDCGSEAKAQVLANSATHDRCRARATIGERHRNNNLPGCPACALPVRVREMPHCKL